MSTTPDHGQSGDDGRPYDHPDELCGACAQRFQAEGAQRRERMAMQVFERTADQVTALAAGLRAVIENCRHTQDMNAIRHQLVGLLPEVQPMPDDLAQRMREKGMGHLVDRHADTVRENWREYGYGD